ncbi:unnamed protein product, partial [Laminaria digitata]
MEYFHLDGGACRPNQVEENSTIKCIDCAELAVFDVAGGGDADFMHCEGYYYTQRAAVLQAGHDLIMKTRSSKKKEVYRSSVVMPQTPRSPQSPQSSQGTGTAQSSRTPQGTSPA